MSWLSIKTGNGRIKIKPRWQMRWAEKMGKVKVIDLGVLLISWWSDDDIRNYK